MTKVPESYVIEEFEEWLNVEQPLDRIIPELSFLLKKADREEYCRLFDEFCLRFGHEIEED